MERVLQSDIFFFITSIAVVLVTVMLVIVLFQIFSIVRSVKHMTKLVEIDMTKAHGAVDQLLARLAKIPMFSFLFSRKRTRKTRLQK